MDRPSQLATLDRFVSVMRDELEENMWKGGWENCSVPSLMSRVSEEFREVFDELTAFYANVTPENFLKMVDPNRISSECADVANMIMMVADVARRRYEELKAEFETRK